MKILIAGATGLIGRELVSLCLENQWQINYLTTSREKLNAIPNAAGYFWNPVANEMDPAALQNVDAIVNLAGASVSKPWTAKYKEIILQSRIQTATTLFNALEDHQHQVKQYVSASGISVYPSSMDQMYFETDSAIGDSFLAKVVVSWEAAADQFDKLGIAVAKVRTGLVLAKEDGAFPQILKPIKFGLGAPLGTGLQWQSWIHVADIANVYAHLLKTKAKGVYNGVSPSPVTNSKLTKTIAHQLGRSLWLPKVPSFILKTALGECSDLVLESQLVSSQKLEESGFRFRFVNIEQAIEDLI